MPTCNLTRQVHFGTEAGAAIGAYSNTVNYSIRARLCTKILYDPLNNLVTDGMLHMPYAVFFRTPDVNAWNAGSKLEGNDMKRSGQIIFSTQN